MRTFLASLILTISAATLAFAQPVRVIQVFDGDTFLAIDAANQPITVRLRGIDAPEKTQKFGRQAGRKLSRFISGKTVTLSNTNIDPYGRTIATVSLRRKDINLSLLKLGMAWHYKFFDQNPKYARAERQAQRRDRGLWKDNNPTPPWEYRE